ncbi:SDR family NAD(P)-dependent oxidoreductase [Gordonia sp. NPDC003376]
MTGPLHGATAIVTGAGRPNGIGAAVARRFARQGARVMITDILAEGARTASSLAAEGLEVGFITHDVADEADWATVIARCSDRFGPPNVLCNNAGIYNGTPILDEDLERWNRTIELNLTSVFLGMRSVIPTMRDHGGGSIINISSIWGLVGAEGGAAYHASKGGVTVLTKHVAAAHVADNIRVNSLHPGGVDTTIMTQSGPDNAQQVAARTPMRRLGTPDEIASAAEYLASPGASYVTGVALPVDGGYTAM